MLSLFITSTNILGHHGWSETYLGLQSFFWSLGNDGTNDGNTVFGSQYVCLFNLEKLFNDRPELKEKPLNFISSIIEGQSLNPAKTDQMKTSQTMETIPLLTY